jgi:hypothetical protein
VDINLDQPYSLVMLSEKAQDGLKSLFATRRENVLFAQDASLLLFSQPFLLEGQARGHSL